jgi:hypothetical protein
MTSNLATLFVTEGLSGLDAAYCLTSKPRLSLKDAQPLKDAHPTARCSLKKCLSKDGAVLKYEAGRKHNGFLRASFLKLILG